MPSKWRKIRRRRWWNSPEIFALKSICNINWNSSAISNWNSAVKCYWPCKSCSATALVGSEIRIPRFQTYFSYQHGYWMVSMANGYKGEKKHNIWINGSFQKGIAFWSRKLLTKLLHWGINHSSISRLEILHSYLPQIVGSPTQVLQSLPYSGRVFWSFALINCSFASFSTWCLWKLSVVSIKTKYKKYQMLIQTNIRTILHLLSLKTVGCYHQTPKYTHISLSCIHIMQGVKNIKCWFKQISEYML